MAADLADQIRIASHLGADVNDALTSCAARPAVWTAAPGHPAWEVPDGTEVLVTTPAAWKAAPARRPPDWPRSIRWVQLESVGIDAFPRWMLEDVVVTSARGSNASAIAEYVMAEILGVEKRVLETAVTSPSEWRRIRMGSPEGKTLGIAGFGAIGHALAARAQPFGMEIKAFKRSPWTEKVPGVEPVETIRDLFAGSDHLVLAMPATPFTRHIVNAEVLASARPGLHVINVARGALIDQEALLAALDAGRLARATLDVTVPEPLPEGHPFYRHPKVRLTPHLAWDGTMNAKRILEIILSNLDAYRTGAPLENIVNLDDGY